MRKGQKKTLCFFKMPHLVKSEVQRLGREDRSSRRRRSADVCRRRDLEDSFPGADVKAVPIDGRLGCKHEASFYLMRRPREGSENKVIHNT